MVFTNNKKGQAAIEFLMTYGWMLLVVLIVGALIFSFVDFGSLMPNKADFNNNIQGKPAESVAVSGDGPDNVNVVFTYNGAKRVNINSSTINLARNDGGTCNISKLKNIDTNDVVLPPNATPFLNGQAGIATFDCTNLLNGDVIEGELTLPYISTTTGLTTTSVGSIRLSITD